jgi:hypothetical protein
MGSSDFTLPAGADQRRQQRRIRSMARHQFDEIHEVPLSIRLQRTGPGLIADVVCAEQFTTEFNRHSLFSGSPVARTQGEGRVTPGGSSLRACAPRYLPEHADDEIGEAVDDCGLLVLCQDLPRFIRRRGASRTGKLSVRAERGCFDGRVYRDGDSLPRAQWRTCIQAQRSILVQVATADQAETDRSWNAIVGNGGEESACGWCKDKWGLSWQITPIALTKR